MTKSMEAIGASMVAALVALAAPEAQAQSGGAMLAGESAFGLVLAGGAITDIAMAISVAKKERIPALYGTGLAFNIVNTLMGSLAVGFAHRMDGSMDVVMYSVGSVILSVGVVGVVLGITGLVKHGKHGGSQLVDDVASGPANMHVDCCLPIS